MNNNDKVRAKKHLGQHFLNDESVAMRIADSLSYTGYEKTLEIGPGMGVLTKYLIHKPTETYVVEIDTESVAYLEKHYPSLHGKIIGEDFLKYNLQKVFGDKPFAIIGNFPYNISTQIVFRVLEMRNQIPEFGGMFQKEVAERIASGPGNKDYGVLSVLLQAFYHIEYLFSVGREEFNPPPNVESGVIRLRRNDIKELPCSVDDFKRVIKTTFNQRRKTIRNSSRPMLQPDSITDHHLFDRRPETLTVEEFVELTGLIYG